jgi:hypothetical protein
MDKFQLILLIILLFGIIIGSNAIAWAEFEEDFDAASDLDSYTGDMAHINARLVQKTTLILHRENMAILKELKEIKKQVLEIKDIIEE